MYKTPEPKDPVWILSVSHRRGVAQFYCASEEHLEEMQLRYVDEVQYVRQATAEDIMDALTSSKFQEEDQEMGRAYAVRDKECGVCGKKSVVVAVFSNPHDAIKVCPFCIGAARVKVRELDDEQEMIFQTQDLENSPSPPCLGRHKVS